MKKYVFLFLMCAMNSTFAANYTLTIDGQSYDLDEGQKTTLTLADGKKISVNLEKKDVLSFATKNFSFEHPQTAAPARSDLGEGVHQTMMTTPLGTLVLVQEYVGLSPDLLVDMMVHELTKEEKDYGYKIETTATDKTLAGGQKLSGKTVVASYQGEVTSRDVISYSTNNGGLMIITMYDNETTAEDMAMIETFWKTLKIVDEE
ncbi:hypothetical protein [Marinicella sp. W31]|uniref:hypothetical protein n=1 Tax=Marinicella sp. W31 TaxID=3023713 RepID=UPI003757AA92